MSSAMPLPVARAQRRLGRDLRHWRLLQGLTMAQVADRADISVPTVRRLESGDGATLENVLRVARALGVLDALAGSIDPYDTDVGRLRADEQLPQRGRSSTGSPP